MIAVSYATALVVYFCVGVLIAAGALHTTKKTGNFGVLPTLTVLVAWPMVVVTLAAAVCIELIYRAIERVRK